MASHLHYISCSTLRKYGPDGPTRLERLVPSTNGMGWGVTDWTGVVRTNHRDEMLNVWNSTSANIPMLRHGTSSPAAYKEFISHERDFKIFTVLESPREALTPWNVQAALEKCWWVPPPLVSNCLSSGLSWDLTRACIFHSLRIVILEITAVARSVETAAFFFVCNNLQQTDLTKGPVT